MPRARNIKPGFFKNEILAELDPLARLLFAGLWCLADREGRLEDRPKRIKAEILPYDDCDVDKFLQDLHEQGFILRYSVNGENYIQIVNFKKHQHPHAKEPASVIPPPPENSNDTISTQEMHHIDTIQEQCEHHTSTMQESDEYDENPSENLKLKTENLKLKTDVSTEEILSSSEADDTLEIDKPKQGKIPYKEIVSLYNEICVSLPRVQEISEKRRRMIRTRWKRHPDLDYFRRLFQKAEDSDFLSGRNGKWAGCNFDWLMNENNAIKVLEGVYDNRADPTHESKIIDYEAASKSKYGW